MEDNKDYFSEYIHEQREAEEARKTLRVWVYVALILFILLVSQTIRYAMLSEAYGDLKYDYDTYVEEHQ